VVTLRLAADSPDRELPWIVTFGPLSHDEGWEPVVCGPYEWAHAIGLAEEVVADDALMAVVEPVIAPVTPEDIRAEIVESRVAEYAPEEVPGGPPPEIAGPDAPLPSPTEVRAGLARVAARLAGDR